MLENLVRNTKIGLVLLGLSGCGTVETVSPILDYMGFALKYNKYCSNPSVDDLRCSEAAVYPLITANFK